MKNTILGFIVASVLVAAPFAASAQSVDIQAQINSLLEQIKVLQLKLAELVKQQPTTVTPPSVTQPSSNARICAILNRNLSQGQSGDDVSGLQEFLNSRGFFEGQATGFFGPLTASAVAKWQMSEGVEGVGMVGPMSRERIKIWCGGSGGGTVDGKLHAEPQKGSAPLTVTFAADVTLTNNTMVADAGDYKIVFGDGSEYVFTCTDTTGMCNGPHKTQHTYTSNGTYAAKLIHYGYFGLANPDGSAPTQTLGTVTIYVGDATGQSGKLSASPNSGDAPLSVSFAYTPVNDDTAQYYVMFGDESEGQIMDRQQIYCITTPCVSPSTASHTYTKNGTYTATVTRYVACLFSSPRCKIAVIPLATVQVTVGSGTTCRPLMYMPILCDGGTPSKPVYDSNGCLVKYECPIANFTPPANCKSWNDGCNTCSRTSPTSPAACTMRACLMTTNTSSEGMTQSIWAGKGYCTAYFDDAAGNKPPVISSVSGPTTLGINQIGTWTILASDPENQQLTYKISWGDESTTGAGMTSSLMIPSSFVQTSTFTHAYATAGTYTVRVVVHDPANGEAVATTNVKVGGDVTVCTMEYAPVCGQPPEPACRHTAPFCAIATPGPTTYSNRCMLNAAGATFISQGVCGTITPVACTADAMMCPNGTYVGRTGPNCEFVCPTTTNICPQYQMPLCPNGTVVAGPTSSNGCPGAPVCRTEGVILY